MISLPLMRPLLPSADKILPYLNRIDQSRWYSNEGSLVLELEERLGSMMSCCAAVTSSGTLGLAASLLAMRYPSNQDWRKVSMPSWTFVATANAAVMAGLSPIFEDVGTAHTGIGVSQFGDPCEGDYLLIDAAGAFDTYASGLSKVGKTPVVISTHATKVFSTGEGGIVLSTDKDFIDRVKTIINHGLDKNKDVKSTGLNGKMSEYHAAVGLASFDKWTEARQKWIERKEKYYEIFGVIGGVSPVATSTMLMRTNTSVIPIIENLRAKGIVSRQVWGRGVHNYPAYKDCQRSDMTQTENLADTTLFLPFFVDMMDDQMKYVADAVRECV